MRRFILSAPLSALLLTGLAMAPAQAQSMNGPMVPEGANQPKPAPAQPPALPGLAGRGRAPIPAEPGAENLPPTEAMFDAINRGDLAAARDAASRGADLNTRNVLGLTALDSAVDQGRNDIAFFLLSARGPGSAPMESGPPSAASGAPLTAPPAGRAARNTTPRETPVREAVRGPTGRTQPVAPRNGSSDGGTPQPNQGFLGFGTGRAAGGG